MNSNKWYNKFERRLNNRLSVIFICAFILSFLFMIYVIVLTLIELSIYSINFSKVGIINFLNAFDWCKAYIGVCFGLYSIYYVFGTYRVYDENKIYSNIVKPHIEEFFIRLHLIKKQNLKMFDHFNHCGKQIITDIIVNEKEHYIQSEQKLQFYFNKYIKDYVSIFEKCEYNANQCKKEICTDLQCKNANPTYYGHCPHSLKSFNAIAYELFCISYTYRDFWTDIEKLYKENISQLVTVKK